MNKQVNPDDLGDASDRQWDIAKGEMPKDCGSYLVYANLEGNCEWNSFFEVLVWFPKEKVWRTPMVGSEPIKGTVYAWWTLPKCQIPTA